MEQKLKILVEFTVTQRADASTLVTSKNFVQSLMLTNVGLRYGKKITKKLVSFKDITNEEK
jgi:hypothetical protein